MEKIVALRKAFIKAIEKHRAFFEQSFPGGVIDAGKKTLYQKLSSTAQWAFTTTTFFCTSLCILPIVRRNDFNFQASVSTRRWIFMAITSLYLLSASHKYVTFGRRILSNQAFDAITCLSMIPCVSYTVYILFCLLVTFYMEDVIELIRGWLQVLSRFNFPGKEEMTPFSDKWSSMTCIQIFLSNASCAFVYPIVSILVDRVPFTVVYAASSVGLVDMKLMPRLAWAVIFSPLEAISYFGPLVVTTFGVMIVCTELGVEKQSVELLRNISKSEQMYLKTVKLYKMLQLQNKVFAAILRPFVTPVLFCAGFLVVFGVYAILKTPDMPLLVVAIILYTCVAVLAAVYFLSASAMVIAKASEDVITQLRSREHPFIRRLPADEKKILRARMRALKSLEFPVGHYARLSFIVTKVMLEEILNQLMFLLSL